MAVDPELGKSLTLVRTSPTFALTERSDGSKTVSNPKQITPDMGVVWLAADTTLANGTAVPSVLVIDTATGDMPRAAYWWVDCTWLEPANPDDRTLLLAALKLGKADVFPYAWTTHVPMALS